MQTLGIVCQGLCIRFATVLQQFHHGIISGLQTVLCRWRQILFTVPVRIGCVAEQIALGSAQQRIFEFIADAGTAPQFLVRHLPQLCLCLGQCMLHVFAHRLVAFLDGIVMFAGELAQCFETLTQLGKFLPRRRHVVDMIFGQLFDLLAQMLGVHHILFAFFLYRVTLLITAGKNLVAGSTETFPQTGIILAGHHAHLTPLPLQAFGLINR